MNSIKVIDQSTRDQALDCQQSFIVQAPAGSGKTELLTQRFLALLAIVEQPEEILAITFTRKAANEMRERIIKALKLAKSTPVQPENEPAATTWSLGIEGLKQNALHKWDLLENPQRLQVKTIDSFCAGLTRRLPYLSGLGAEANTTEQAAVLYRQAAHQTLALINSDNKRWTTAIESLLVHLDGNQNRAEKLLAEMLGRRDQWLRHLIHDEEDFVPFRVELEHSLSSLISQELVEKAGLLTTKEVDELQVLSQYACENISTNQPDDPFVKQLNSGLSAELNIDTYLQWQAISRWLLTANHTLRKTMTKNSGFPAPSSVDDQSQKEYFKMMKERMVALLETLVDKELWFIEMSQLPPIKYQQSQWQLLKVLMRCLKLATGQLHVIFSQRGEMDFQEVSLRALQALGEDDQPTDLTLALDYKLQHILIDEFQDTSHGQFRLLEKLLYGWFPDDGRSLFLVGDPMQSIYRFREADVGLFLRVKKHGIANMHPRSITLKVNFRSTKQIVSWVNETFCNILPKNQNISHGAVTYAQSTAFDQTQSGSVEIYPFFNDDGQLEANKVTKLVTKHCVDNPDLSLAVLVKSRSQLAKLIPTFQQAGLKFKATEIELLGHRPIITDLQMIFRAITDPTDRIAWLAILRGPWCGLSLADLLEISAEKASSIMVNCQSAKICQRLSGEGAARLSTLLNRILPWININSRCNIRQRVEGCWLGIDGPSFIDNETDLQAAELYFDLLSEVAQGGAIKDPQALQQQLALLYAPVASDANAQLQLMTIHKSKGLEFDTVILPALNSGSRPDDLTLLRWMEITLKNSSGLLMAPIHAHINERDPVYDYLATISAKKRHYEYGRQLYVACTRAKRRLILTATIKTNTELEPQQLKAKKGSQLYELWSATGAMTKTAFSEYLAEIPAQHDEIAQLKHHPLKRVKIAQQYFSDELFPEPVNLQVQLAPSQEQTSLFTASMMKRHVGTVTHSWLEQISDNIQHWDTQRISVQQPVLKNQLQQLGVASKDLDKAVQLVTHNLQQTLKDPQGRFLLEQHLHSASELALEKQEADEFKSYIIDRTFVDAQGVRWIIDYKTSSHQGADREDFLMQQKQYYLPQLENYAKLFAELESRPIKLVLYFTCYQKLISWDWSGIEMNET